MDSKISQLELELQSAREEAIANKTTLLYADREDHAYSEGEISAYNYALAMIKKIYIYSEK